MRKTLSLVEVSESTVTLLNEWSTASLRAACAASAETGISEVRTQSIVAMSGWIMPEPLHMPPMR